MGQRLVTGRENGCDFGVNVRAASGGGKRAVRGEVGAAERELDAAFDSPVAHGAVALTLGTASKNRGQQCRDGKVGEIQMGPHVGTERHACKGAGVMRHPEAGLPAAHWLDARGPPYRFVELAAPGPPERAKTALCSDTRTKASSE